MTTPIENRVSRVWHKLGQVAYLALFVAGLYLVAINMPSQLEPEAYICTSTPCRYEAVFPSELQALEPVGLTQNAYIQYRFWTDTPLILILFLGVSLLIFLLRRGEWIGLLSATFLLTFPVAIITGEMAAQAGPWLLIPLVAFSITGGSSLVVLFYVFPDGKFVPGWTRWLALLILIWSLGNVLVTYDLSKTGEGTALINIVTGIYFVLLMLAFATQVYRYRKVSTPVQRQQAKWVVTAAFMMPFCDLIVRGIILNNWLGLAETPGPGRVIHYMITIPTLRTLPFMLVPVSFAFAILRYRLWDIDILVRRTLQYSVLTSLMAGLYFGSVLLFQTVLHGLGWQQSALTTVITTLAIVFLFNPLRKRVQAFIDRRFYRSKYNAEKTLEKFAASTRIQTDLAGMTSELVQVVGEVMQPDRLGLWLVQRRKKEGIQ